MRAGGGTIPWTVFEKMRSPLITSLRNNEERDKNLRPNLPFRSRCFTMLDRYLDHVGSDRLCTAMTPN